jgi:hypothetical protein
LGDKPVALKTGKVRAHRIISQVQRIGEFVDCAFPTSKELEDFPAGTFEQAVTPAYIFH